MRPCPIPRNHGSDFKDHEFQVFSQNGEDGLLAYLFDIVEFSSRRFVEFGFGLLENNCLRLVLSEGFTGLFLDGNAEDCELLNRLRIPGVSAINSWLTLENINTILAAHVAKDADVLSLDVDGNDYWIWKALDALEPRIIVVEYIRVLGPTVR